MVFLCLPYLEFVDLGFVSLEFSSSLKKLSSLCLEVFFFYPLFSSPCRLPITYIYKLHGIVQWVTKAVCVFF